MYQRLVKIFVIVTLFSAVLTAGQTGKITGTVVDQETGNPLPGVNVLLEGTSMGAATNSDGKFVILDIPPGLYLVKFSFIGYATITIENVRSTTDLTTNLYTINMNPEAIEGETITVTAERPLIELMPPMKYMLYEPRILKTYQFVVTPMLLPCKPVLLMMKGRFTYAGAVLRKLVIMLMA